MVIAILKWQQNKKTTMWQLEHWSRFPQKSKNYFSGSGQRLTSSRILSHTQEWYRISEEATTKEWVLDVSSSSSSKSHSMGLQRLPWRDLIINLVIYSSGVLKFTPSHTKQGNKNSRNVLQIASYCWQWDSILHYSTFELGYITELNDSYRSQGHAAGKHAHSLSFQIHTEHSGILKSLTSPGPAVLFQTFLEAHFYQKTTKAHT